MSAQRAANVPPRITMTSSPGDVRLTTADSIAPVPDDATKTTSPCVSKSGLQPVSSFDRSSTICGDRWLNRGRSPASLTTSGTCMGPGKNKSGFLITAYKTPFKAKYDDNSYDDRLDCYIWPVHSGA